MIVTCVYLRSSESHKRRSYVYFCLRSVGTVRMSEGSDPRLIPSLWRVVCGVVYMSAVHHQSIIIDHRSLYQSINGKKIKCSLLYQATTR